VGATVVVLLAGCIADDGDDGAASDAPATTSTTSTTATTESDGDGVGPGDGPDSSLTTTTETTPSTTLPDGLVAVPLDQELVDRLPSVSGGERQIDTDAAFDERLCDGTKAPAVPEGQARATYVVSPTDQITVAAYRFGSDGGAFYTASYAAAVRSCATEASESEGLGLPEVIGSSFRLTTDRGEAFVAVAYYEDVLWVLFQESTDGPAEIQQTTLDVFAQTVLD
jgi:hypothetical protein